MFYRNFASFICIFVGAVIAAAHNHTHSVTGSELEGTVYSLTTENPESSTREPDHQVTESTAIDLGALLDAGDGAVVTLVTGDTRLAAHKAVLTARSPVFAARFQGMTLEARTGEVAIPDVEGPVLRQMLAYMYTLQAPQLPSMAPQLLVAADTYGLSALKAHCEHQVAAQLSVETAAAAAVLAVRHSCSSLVQAAVAFIRSHVFHVMATRGWRDAMNSQPEELMKVIQLLTDSPAEASVPATGGSGAAPTTQPHSDHSGHRGQTAASTAPPTTALSTSPSDDAVSRMRSLSAEEKNRRLIKAAKEGAVQEVKALLPAGADVGATDERGYTALHWAGYRGHVEAVEALLAAGVDMEARSRWGETALHFAAYGGHVEAVKALLAAGADVGSRGELGYTPLHRAAGRGHVEVARRLLAAGAEVEARNQEGETPLHYAAALGQAAMVRLLVEEASADPNARSERGGTPLHAAAENGQAEAAAALLQAGADKGATDNRGQTPLDIAREENHQQLIDMLTT